MFHDPRLADSEICTQCPEPGGVLFNILYFRSMKNTRIKTAKKRSSLSRAKLENVVAAAYASKGPFLIASVIVTRESGKSKK